MVVLVVRAVLIAGAYLAWRFVWGQRVLPSLATLRPPDVAWDGDRLVFGGFDHSRGPLLTRYIVVDERNTVLGAPEGLKKAPFVELATTTSHHPALLWIELTGKTLRLRTATYLRDTGWTPTRELFHGRQILFSGERPVADRTMPDRYRLALVAPLNAPRALLQLHMTDSGWSVGSTVKQPEVFWLTREAVGVADSAGSQWYAISGRLDATQEAAVVVVEPSGAETIAWRGVGSVNRLAAVETAGTRRIFAAVLQDAAAPGENQKHALVVLRQRDADKTWTLENTEDFTGQIQRLHILAASHDAYTLGVEHANFEKQELDVWEIRGPATPQLARRQLAPTNTLNQVRWLRDRDAALQILAVHTSATGWTTHRVPAP